MPQLVGITRYIDRDDLAVLDLQRRGLQYVALLDGDKAGQAVDEAVTYDA
jgi:hypothetical protein